MRKKNIFMIIIIVLIVIVALILYPKIQTISKKKFNTANICDRIKNKQNAKNNFVIHIVKNNEYNGNNKVERLTSEYSDLELISSKKMNLQQKCFFDSVIKENSLEYLINDSSEEIFVVYKDGKFISATSDPDYYNLIDFLNKYGVITIKKINENTNLNKIKENIKTKYVLFILSDENQRETISHYASKYISNVTYDIIDLRSDEGSLIDKYIIDNYRVSNFYPKALYFKNSKLMKESTVYDLEQEYYEFAKYIK